MYETRDYMLYRDKALRDELAEAASIAEYFQRLGVNNGNNVFTRLDRVSPPGPRQAVPLAQHLPWLIQTYDGMGERIPQKA